MAASSRLSNAPAGLAISARLVDGDEQLDVDVVVVPVLDADGDALDAYDATFPRPASFPVQLDWIEDEGEPTERLIVSEIIDSVDHGTDAPLLVGLDELKDYLAIPAADHVHDLMLTRAIRTARPLIEAIVGPVIPVTATEWHDGGRPFVQLRRTPSTALGTTPILELVSCTEWVGSTGHELAIAANPGAASTYSVMLDELGTVTRRTSGGGISAFAGGPRSVQVTYATGQQEVPANVVDGTLELIRANYQTTRATGRGRMAPVDELEAGPPLGFYVPRRVRELLAPNRRHPSVA